MDAPLDAVLQVKPADDEISIATWWLLADSLRYAVIVRRALDGVEVLDAASFRLETSRARLTAEAVIQQLEIDRVDDSTSLDGLARSHRHPLAPTLRTTICDLARLIVSSHPTPEVTLRGAIAAHLEALHVAAARGEESDVAKVTWVSEGRDQVVCQPQLRGPGHRPRRW